ncbi:MAG TPA: GNAT family N-acetyltransferase [Tepidisphaeraceae bacterium]|jgi:predicted acetyltransferase
MKPRPKLHRVRRIDEKIIANLVRFYVYDMSEHMGWDCPKNGLFGGCDDLPKYWTARGNQAFLIRSGKELVGFALVEANPEHGVDYRIGEFFVLRKFRRKRVGERIAREIFDRFRGRWQVEQLKKNTPAVEFWREVIRRYTRGKFSEKSSVSQFGRHNVIMFRNDTPTMHQKSS